MLAESIFHWVSVHGYLGIFLLLMLGIVGLPVPDETLLILTGYLVYKGDLDILPALAAAFTGSVYGITLSYGLGRIGGAALLEKYGNVVHLSEARVKQVKDWFERRGKWVLMFGYFVPGLRHITALVVGASKLSYSVFSLFAYSGAFVWATTFIFVGYISGREWMKTPAAVHRGILILLGLSLCVLLLYFVLRRKRGRHG